jgi:hypothetical protein
VLPQITIYVIVAYWFPRSGGVADTTWYPGAILIVGTGLAAVYAMRAPRLDAATVSLLCLGAFAVWSYASISWATASATAWDGANLAATYAVVYAIFAFGPRRDRLEPWVLVAFALVVAAIGLHAVHEGASSTSLTFLGGRLASPTDYANASAAGFLIPAWMTLAIAVGKSVPLALRAVALGIASTLFDLAALTESRGGAIAAAATSVFFVLWVSRRLVAGWMLGAVAATSALFVVHADAFNLTSTGRPSPAGIHQTEVLLIVTAITMAGAFAIASQSWRFIAAASPRTARAARQSIAVTTVIALGAAATFGAIRIGSPASAARSAWSSFKDPSEPVGTHRFTSLGSHRYDAWRVSLELFGRHPVAGIGSENFAEGYVRLRRSDEELTYPHSLVMGLLEQTGLVGAVLFVCFLVAATLSAARARAAKASVPAAGAVAFLYFLVHGSGDWLWEFPMLGTISFAAAGLAVRPRRTVDHRPSIVDRALRPASFVALALCICSFVPPWLSARDAATAARTWAADPAAGLALYDRAARENPLDDGPLVSAGVVAGHLGRVATMVRYLQRAERRNPQNWFTNLELGVAFSMLGKWGSASAAVVRARSLNPHEQLIRQVETRVMHRQPVSPRFVENAAYNRARALGVNQ